MSVRSGSIGSDMSCPACGSTGSAGGLETDRSCSAGACIECSICCGCAGSFDACVDWGDAVSWPACGSPGFDDSGRSEEHTSELQSLMRISYAVFCLKKKTTI